ncbi:MAG: CopG family ribbon-helix-helix protein [Candidatus Melainabacteria bacterium]
MARVLISMKEEFLKRIDEVAEAEQRSRSELIREALRMYIRKTPAQATMTNPVTGQTDSLAQ